MTPEQYVQERAAASGSSFYYAFLFLPPPRRAAITAFYAFCREVDDVVDEASDPSVAATKLAWWRSEVQRAYAGQPTHPATQALMPHAATYDIRADHLLAVIEGCAMDLNQSRYLDFPGLSRYCHLVAGVVGEVAASIFGRTEAQTIEYAHRMGLAVQLTNIIRDVGDDARREYLYKFVSAAPWEAADATRTDRLAVGDKYLDEGTLYVAKFNADGTGQWLPLVYGQVPDRAAVGSDPAYTFASQADILVNARLAADALGATPMDRPEWTAVNPVTGEVYLTLTNNNASGRPLAGTDAANPRHYVEPVGSSTSTGNPNGHIIRLREGGDNPAATAFLWDIYLFGADSTDAGAQVNLSGLTADNDFSSPDGLWFARNQNVAGQVRPLLWVQTDDGALTDRTNNQMLAALPGFVGDGAARTITNTDAGGATRSQATFVGQAATGATLKRFLTGPKQCEITGVDSTPDGRTLFVGIQHPGEDGSAAAPSSNWPQSQSGTASGRPRSGVVVITRSTGGVVGL